MDHSHGAAIRAAAEPRSECILVLAPAEQEAALVTATLAEAQVRVLLCADVAELCRGIEAGAGAALLAEEALPPAGLAELAACLQRQPAWSDFPLILLASGGTQARTIYESLVAVGPVAVLRRPLEPFALCSAAQLALRIRRRQYAGRDLLKQEQRREEPERESERLRDAHDELKQHANARHAGLTASEARFRAVFEQAAVGIVEADADMRFLAANPGFCQMLGYTEPELLGRSVLDITHPDDAERDEVMIRRILRHELPSFTVEKRYLRKDGRVIWAQLTASVAEVPGRAPCLLAIVEDITVRKRAEADRAASEARFRSIFAQAAVGIAQTTPEGVLTIVNDRLARMLGYPVEELIGKRMQDLTWPEDQAEDEEMHARVMAGEVASYTLEKRFQRHDGTLLWTEVTCSTGRNAAGTLGFWIVVVQDISEWKAAQEALLHEHSATESERGRLRAVLDILPVAVCIADAGGQVTESNRVARQIWGGAGGAKCGADGPRIWRSEATLPLNPEERALQRALRAGEVIVGEELAVEAADGSFRTLLEYAVPIYNPAGEIAGAVAVNVDVTRLKKTEAAVKALNETLEQRVTDRTATLSLLHDVASAANRAASFEDAIEDVLGRICRHYTWHAGRAFLRVVDAPDEIVAVACTCEARELQSTLCPVVVRLKRGEDLAGCVYQSGRAEWTEELPPALAAVVDDQGRPLVRSRVAFPVLIGDEVAAVLEFFSSDTGPVIARVQETLFNVGVHLSRLIERRRVEEQLSKTERFASLGTFSAGLGHELNNPLASILMAARFGARTASRELPDIRELFREIVEDAERCARTVKSVLQFARREPLEKWPADLNTSIRRAIALARPQAEDWKVEVAAGLADPAPRVLANPTGLEQAFFHVIQNAIQASRPGQTVRVTSEAVGDFMRVRISDHGRGMTLEERRRAFDPFYTGRVWRGGSGLGLSLAHSIILEHGGRIEIESQMNRGTTIRVELPLYESSPDVAPDTGA